MKNIRDDSKSFFMKKPKIDDSNFLYTYEDMTFDLDRLNTTYYKKMLVKTIAITKDNKEVYEVIIGKPNGKKRIIIHAGIHAREYMTSLLVMKQMECYLQCLEQETYRGISYGDLFSDITFHILPMVNPDGVSISQFGLNKIQRDTIRREIKEWYQRDLASGRTKDTFDMYLKRWKANANGVDLNRNFNYGWKEYTGIDVPGPEKYKGVTVESEPETKALVLLTKEIKPVVAISYHATGSVIYWDYGQIGDMRNQCQAVVNTISKVTGYEVSYADTDKQDAAGYGDWAVMVKEVPSATIEIGIGEAPLSIDEFPRIWKENRWIMEELAYQIQ